MLAHRSVTAFKPSIAQAVGDAEDSKGGKTICCKSCIQKWDLEKMEGMPDQYTAPSHAGSCKQNILHLTPQKLQLIACRAFACTGSHCVDKTSTATMLPCGCFEIIVSETASILALCCMRHDDALPVFNTEFMIAFSQLSQPASGCCPSLRETALLKD